MAVAPPVQLILALVSLGITVTIGVVGGGIKVVTVVPTEFVKFVELIALTTSVYAVDGVSSVNVTDLLDNALSVEGTTESPFKVYE